MKMILLCICVLACLSMARADRTPGAVQWPGWNISADEDVISARYPLSNLADGNPQTAWVFNKTRTDQESKPTPFNHGIGKALTIRTDTGIPFTLDGITLINGYAKDAATYQRNNRIRNITISVYDGKEHTYSFPLRETQALQRCTFPKVTTRNLGISFDQVDAGKDDDLCISELALLHGGKAVDWGLTPFVLTNDATTTCCGGTTLELRTQGGLLLPGPDGKPLDFVAAAPQPGTHVLLLAAPKCLYLFDLDRGVYLHEQALPGELTLSPSIGWLDARTAAVAVAPESGQWEQQVWYVLRVHAGYAWERTDWPAKKRPKFLPGARGPYYSV